MWQLSLIHIYSPFLQATVQNKVIRRLSRHRFQFGEQIGAGHTHFTGKDVDIEICIIQVAVSYTHLDVYKRQEGDFGRRYCVMRL